MNNPFSPQILNTKKTMSYCDQNPSPGLGVAQLCGGVKSVAGIPTLTLFIVETVHVLL